MKWKRTWKMKWKVVLGDAPENRILTPQDKSIDDSCPFYTRGVGGSLLVFGREPATEKWRFIKLSVRKWPLRKRNSGPAGKIQ